MYASDFTIKPWYKSINLHALTKSIHKFHSTRWMRYIFRISTGTRSFRLVTIAAMVRVCQELMFHFIQFSLNVKRDLVGIQCDDISRRFELRTCPGGGPRVVVSTAAFHARVRGSVPDLGGLKETRNVSSPSTCESQYCGEPPWPRGSVLCLRPLGLEFRILCLEDSVISIISPSSGGSPGPV